MSWRRLAATTAAALVVAAGVVLLLQVTVHRAGTPARSCGSAWDVVAGRTGWPEWWSQDLADPATGGGRLVRTLECPGAVNDRVVASGVLALGAVLLGSVELGSRRGTGGRRPATAGTAGRLRRLGVALTVLGSVLTAGGLVGIALLVADPHHALFLYVSRPVVVLAGLLLTLPAVLLVALGRGAGVLSAHLDGREDGREEA